MNSAVGAYGLLAITGSIVVAVYGLRLLIETVTLLEISEMPRKDTPEERVLNLLKTRNEEVMELLDELRSQALYEGKAVACSGFARRYNLLFKENENILRRIEKLRGDGGEVL